MRNEEVSAVSENKYGPVAQRIEQRFPKPLVGGSTPPGAPTHTKQTRLAKRQECQGVDSLYRHYLAKENLPLLPVN
jgi:hypothetical protein